MTEALDRGRDAFARRAWGDAFAELSAADDEDPLESDDLERLALAARMAGYVGVGDDVWPRAFHLATLEGNPTRAARYALQLSSELLRRGEVARSGGWVARAQRLLADVPSDRVEQGYLLIDAAYQRVFARDWAGAYTVFTQAGEVADRCGDADLKSLAHQGRGRTLILTGDVARGVAMLDEAMVAVTAGEVSPWIAGEVYCSVIEGCQEIFDLRRAQEWTAAFSQWCAAQPELVPYRGQCLVHRAQIMQLHGAWSDALDEVRQACDRLSQPPAHPAIGLAHYQRGELHRLRGELADADEAYRAAHQSGREPQPGLALLRLAQGQVEAAHAAIRRVVDEAHDPVPRAQVLAAYVEIALAAGDVAAARDAAEELFSVATDLGAPALSSLAGHARGAVLLAEGNARAALGALRHALALAQELNAPYEAARARVLLGRACRDAHDNEGAAMEFDAARTVFEHLGAATDLRAVEPLLERSVPRAVGGLTAREMQVLTLVAKGRSNRAIAAELVISEKTVARHISNIFTKVGVSSRSAATAYAYDHSLV